MYLISAYFDEKSNQRLGRYIDKIARETGNSFLIENHVPPHLTISSVEARQGELLIPAVEALQGKLYSDSIQIVSVGKSLDKDNRIS